MTRESNEDMGAEMLEWFDRYVKNAPPRAAAKVAAQKRQLGDCGEKKMRSMFLLAPLLLALTACGAVDSMKNAFAHSQEVATDLERSVGSKPIVGFNWANGSLVQVTVNFQGVPGKPLGQIMQLSKRAVAARFQQTPKDLVVTFTVPGQ
jgi:hypothetical protein